MPYVEKPHEQALKPIEPQPEQTNDTPDVEADREETTPQVEPHTENPQEPTEPTEPIEKVVDEPKTDDTETETPPKEETTPKKEENVNQQKTSYKPEEPWGVKRDKNGRLMKGSHLNDAGKPAGALHLTTLLKKAIVKIANDEGDTQDKLIIEKAIEQAKKGNFKYTELIFDRLEGKPKQQVMVQAQIDDNLTEEQKRSLDALFINDQQESPTNDDPGDTAGTPVSD